MRVMDLSRSFALLLVPTLLVACGPKEEETVDPDAHHKVEADWVPEEMGPGRHYAYAFQWFAMGTVLAALLAWNFRKRGLES